MGELIGHQKNWQYFSSVLKGGLLKHAYLFTGPEMIGKRLFAEKLYLTINQQEKIEERDPYFLKIGQEAKNPSSIGIDTVRSIKSFFNLRPAPGFIKCVIVDDAHKLTDEASNALLKVLEEPPFGSLVILVTHLPGQIPRTVKSRCEEVKFSTLSQEEILKTPAVSEIPKSKLEFSIKIASGRPGCLARLSENDQIKEAEQSVEDLRLALKKGIVERFQYAQKLSEGDELNQTVTWWLDWVSASLKDSHKSAEGRHKAAPILRELLVLQNLVSQPQYNSRLALENFFLRV